MTAASKRSSSPRSGFRAARDRTHNYDQPKRKNPRVREAKSTTAGPRREGSAASLSDPGPDVVVGAGPTPPRPPRRRSWRPASGSSCLTPASRSSPSARRRGNAWPPPLRRCGQSSDVALTRFSDQGESGLGYKRLFGSDLAFRDDGVLALSGRPGRGSATVVCPRGAQQRLGIGPAPLYQSGSRRLADHRRRARRRLPSRARFHALRRRGRRARGALPALARARWTAPSHASRRGAACSDYAAIVARLLPAAITSERRVWRSASATSAPSNGCVYCGHCLDGASVRPHLQRRPDVRGPAREGTDRVSLGPARRPDRQSATARS